MTIFIVLLSAVYIGYLICEKVNVTRARRALGHVIHVNGTRGKSSVSRLIEAGLRAGGMRVYCKTTGTDPMTIDTRGREKPLSRRGAANIKEQIAVLCAAAKEGAEVLVIECMAISPELQHASQHDILKADIGVITNVRRDHTDVMGISLDMICDSLCETIPRAGLLFTAEEERFGRLQGAAERLGSNAVCVRPEGDEGDIDFPENVALAAAVCGALHVGRETALSGMRSYNRDPYALSLYVFHGALFINGLSINDVHSSAAVWETLSRRYALEDKELILLVNNRADRGSRTEDMLRLCGLLRPAEVWLAGAARRYMERSIKKQCGPPRVRYLRGAEDLTAEALGASQVIFAVGNIAGPGRALLSRVKKEGKPFV